MNTSTLPPHIELTESHSGRVRGSTQVACMPALVHWFQICQSQMRSVPLAASMQSIAASAARGCMNPAKDSHSRIVESKLSQWLLGADREQVAGWPALLSQSRSWLGGASSVPGSISSQTEGSPAWDRVAPSRASSWVCAGSALPVSGLAA